MSGVVTPRPCSELPRSTSPAPTPPRMQAGFAIQEEARAEIEAEFDEAKRRHDLEWEEYKEAGVAAAQAERAAAAAAESDGDDEEKDGDTA